MNLRANPIDSKDPTALYKRCQDGILLWYFNREYIHDSYSFIRFSFEYSKLINVAVPKTIDERVINLNFSKQDIFRQSENLELGNIKFDFSMYRTIMFSLLFSN